MEYASDLKELILAKLLLLFETKNPAQKLSNMVDPGRIELPSESNPLLESTMRSLRFRLGLRRTQTNYANPPPIFILLST